MNAKNLIHEYLNKLKKIEKKILKFLNTETDDESHFKDIIQFLEEHQIKNNKNDLTIILHVISYISSNHHHAPFFYNKIERILNLFQENIKNYYSNEEIFNIFKNSKRILLYLFDTKILIPDKKIYDIIIQNKYIMSRYIKYFFKEFKPFYDEYELPNSFLFGSPEIKIEDDPETYEKKRKIGENDDYICELIRNDSVVDFIKYVNKNNYPLSSQIKKSIYETNSYLNHQKHTLIEYAAFFGSIQIFNYLIQNNVELTSSLWIYAIHSNNPELIHILESNQIKLDKETYEACIIESIKCHHFEISKYFINMNLVDTNQIVNFKILQKYNLVLLNEKIDEILEEIEEYLFYIIKYDYTQIASYIIKYDTSIDINKKKHIKKNKKIYINDDADTKNFLQDIIESCKNDEYYELLFKPSKSIELDITNLYIATEKENIEIIECLLNRPEIDINLQTEITKLDNEDSDETNDTVIQSALFVAVEHENIDIVKLFLSNKSIDINLNSKSVEWYSGSTDEQSVLRFAISINNFEIVDLLLKQPNINIESFDNIINESCRIIEPLLFYAVKYRNPKIVQLLLSRDDVDVNSKFKKIYYKMDENNKYTIEDYVNNERTSLSTAVYNNDIEIVKLLLSKKEIDVNFKFYSYIEGDLEVDEYFKIIIDKNDDDDYYYVDERNKCDKRSIEESALFIAVGRCHIEIVELLLSQNEIDVNFVSTLIEYKFNDDDGKLFEYHKRKWTALHLAVYLENKEIIQMLLKHKNININIIDEDKKKPIDLTSNDEIKTLFPK